MKKLLLLLLLACAGSAIAQDTIPLPPKRPDTPRTPLRDRIFTGGNLGLNFGSLTYINVSPILGYRVTPKFSTGFGVTYSYFSDNRDPSFKFETNTYGGRLFAQYEVFENAIAYSEYELLNMEVPNLLFTDLVRKNISSLFVGGGYAQPMGRNSAFMIMVLFNVLESDYVIYENPVIRMGVNLGF